MLVTMAFGTGWLMNNLVVFPGVDWVWTLSLLVGGVLGIARVGLLAAHLHQDDIALGAAALGAEQISDGPRDEQQQRKWDFDLHGDLRVETPNHSGVSRDW